VTVDTHSRDSQLAVATGRFRSYGVALSSATPRRALITVSVMLASIMSSLDTTIATSLYRAFKARSRQPRIR